MTRPTLLILAALGWSFGPAAGQDVDPYAAEDSLETRVWLDRGADPVVERGDEVRVYYRTSRDAYAAIFRIDTDGRITLVYPQHPDADPYVVGGRDYRLVFPDGARWRVSEDPGVGYFFMVASDAPLDFSLFGYDDDTGWDLRGVGETVYEDPYIAIDDYVAAVLPDWEAVGYALDFLEYSVDEEHDYPRFLCYECHDYRPYSSWDPYARACSSVQVVIWDDPYFYPRFRYVGTRVVFARPIGPRPRYSVTARLVGSGPRPIVRSRPAPPPRTAAFKESPRGRPAFTPRRGVPPSDRILGPSGTRASPSGRTIARPGAAVTRDGRVGAARRQPPRPSARRGIPPTVRGIPASAPTPQDRSRPTLQRRPPRSAASARPVRPPRSGATASPPRSGAGARPVRPPRPVGSATPPRGSGRAAPTRVRRPGGNSPAARPPRASGRAAPSRPPRSGARASPPRRPPPSAGSPRPTTSSPGRRPGG